MRIKIFHTKSRQRKVKLFEKIVNIDVDRNKVSIEYLKRMTKISNIKRFEFM